MQLTTGMSRNNPYLAPLLSLLIPGAGQIYLRRVWRGLTILFSAILLAYLINWELNNGKIGLTTFGAVETSWLWIPFLLFVLWNVYDAHRLVTAAPSLDWV